MFTCQTCKQEVERYANHKECRTCYNERMRVYMLARYHERRAESYALLGGKCVECGSTENLEIDHIDRAKKKIKLSSLWSCSREKYFAELTLCQLLCKEHHKIKSIREISVPHGGGLSGKRNCKCEPCRVKRREYMRNRKRSLSKKNNPTPS